MEYSIPRQNLDHQIFLDRNHIDKEVLPWKDEQNPFLNPYRLVSLLDILRVYADEYIFIGELLAWIYICFQNDLISTDEERDRLKATLVNLKEHCDKLHLKVSSALLNDAINNLPQGHREFAILSNAIKKEISSNLFLYIPPNRAKYHNKASTFKTGSFPNASKELIGAGNCYAVGEYTACVFHSMRAAEIGLRTLAKHLNVTFPFPIELADWNNIIDKIDHEIKSMKQLPKGSKKDEELKFFSAAAAQFRYFKDAYRIFVAHARETYDEGQAFSIMQGTVDFLDSLSSKLSE